MKILATCILFIVLGCTTVHVVLQHGADEQPASHKNKAESPADPVQPSVANVKDGNPEKPPTDKKDTASDKNVNKIALWGFVVNFAIGVATLVIAGYAVVQAKATKLNAEAYVGSQRAWVMVDVKRDDRKWSDGLFHMVEGESTEEGKTETFYASISYFNEGASPAWISETIAKCEIVKELREVPEVPNYEGSEVIDDQPTPLGIGRSAPHTKDVSFIAVASGHTGTGGIFVVYGAVRYKDIFSKPHETRFGFSVSKNGKFSRLPNYEYNKHT